jgi:hypothetical protein
MTASYPLVFVFARKLSGRKMNLRAAARRPVQNGWKRIVRAPIDVTK